LTFVLGLAAIIVVFVFVGHGNIRIGPWLKVEVPPVAGGSGGSASAESGGKAFGGTGGPAGPIGSGGAGGDAHADGPNSVAIGGPGGGGGVGLGGPGGSVQAGSGGLVAGGEGGEAGQPDGRGGRGGRNGLEAAGIPNRQLPDGIWLWDYGRGGNGGSTSEYVENLAVIEHLRAEYILAHSGQPETSLHQIQSVPADWLNGELQKRGETWRVRVRNGEYEFYSSGAESH
jgi:hypothetical protein